MKPQAAYSIISSQKRRDLLQVALLCYKSLHRLLSEWIMMAEDREELAAVGKDLIELGVRIQGAADAPMPEVWAITTEPLAFDEWKKEQRELSEAINLHLQKLKDDGSGWGIVMCELYRQKELSNMRFYSTFNSEMAELADMRADRIERIKCVPTVEEKLVRLGRWLTQEDLIG